MYGDNRNIRYFIGIGIVIVLLFVVIALIMRSGGNDNKVPETKKELTSYSDDSSFSVSESIIGPITAESTHNEVDITVSNTEATIDIIQGYDGNVINSRTYPMTESGFSEFLASLQKAGYTDGDTQADLKNSEGYCSTGNRYIFAANDNSSTVQQFWATNCGGTKTYRGNLGLTLDLFQAQIPDYEELTENINLD